MAPLPYTRALKFFLKYRTISEKRPYSNCYNLSRCLAHIVTISNGHPDLYKPQTWVGVYTDNFS